MMALLQRRNRFYDTARFSQPEIRVCHRKGTGKKSPRYLLKSGCCEQKLEIYYADDGRRRVGAYRSGQDSFH